MVVSVPEGWLHNSVRGKPFQHYFRDNLSLCGKVRLRQLIFGCCFRRDISKRKKCPECDRLQRLGQEKTCNG